MSNSFRPLELCRKLSHTLALNKQKCKAKHTWFAQNDVPFCNLCFSSLYEISEWLPCCSQWDKEAHPVNSNIWGRWSFSWRRKKNLPSCLPKARSRARDLTETKSLNLMNRVNRGELLELGVLLYPIYPNWKPSAHVTHGIQRHLYEQGPALVDARQSHNMSQQFHTRWTWIPTDEVEPQQTGTLPESNKSSAVCLYTDEPRVKGYIPLESFRYCTAWKRARHQLDSNHNLHSASPTQI